MAPKVFEGAQDEKNDIWSLGVLMFVMLCGYLPFQGISKPEVILKIK
jgi:serine/threonine protein kinase